MEARVLTLFDDEDFLPKTEAPKKPVKKVTAASKPDAAEPAPAETEARTEAPAASVPEAMPEMLIEEGADSPVAAPPAEALDESPDATVLRTQNTFAEETAETPSSFISIELPGQPPATVAAPSTVPEPEKTPATPAADEAKTADEELNRQILSELVQLDYTALIHRDYPFDIQQASVVKKEKPAARHPEPVEEPEPAAAEDEAFEEVVPLPEWNLDKKYYTIGEVAQLFAVNTSHIRFWTNEFKLKPRTTRKGDRLYSPKDIAELRLIHHLVKEKKHTIKGAREKLKAEKTGVNQKLDLKESLTGLRDMLLRIHEQL
ncbi:MerR family transcriptional regulator [Taibaiella helva]|uniref:MerR family transcriptional regulator n=1 Tax=Taibaiella helva TaxID=2301235 RepID=UPI0018E594C7|nr:MerR family transcriptional regulator [Taibaiella helva]